MVKEALCKHANEVNSGIGNNGCTHRRLVPSGLYRAQRAQRILAKHMYKGTMWVWHYDRSYTPVFNHKQVL